MGTYRLNQGSGGRAYFTLFGEDGERLLSSEMYATRGAALAGIAAVRENCPHDGQYRRADSGESQFFFTLESKNGEPLGRSENYLTRQARESGIDAVKKNGRASPLKE